MPLVKKTKEEILSEIIRGRLKPTKIGTIEYSGDIFYSDISSSQFKNFKKNKDSLSENEKKILHEIAEIKRQKKGCAPRFSALNWLAISNRVAIPWLARVAKTSGAAKTKTSTKQA